MKTRKLLGMLTMALGLTMITVVICDLRNPMMSFLIGRPAQVYILLSSLCAVTSGVVLIRDYLLSEGEAKTKPTEEAKKTDRTEKKEPAPIKSRETASDSAAETAKSPASRIADNSAGRKTAPIEKKNPSTVPERAAEMPKSTPVAKTGAAEAPKSARRAASAAAENSAPAPTAEMRSPEKVGSTPRQAKNRTVSLSAAETESPSVTEFSLEDILNEDW